MRIDAVSFDMDGTLIRNGDSVRYLCMLNNNLEKLEALEYLENQGAITWIEADHLKAQLIQGLDLKEVEERFDESIDLIANIKKTLTYLRKRRIKSVLVTAGPKQVAEILGARFGISGVYGSLYEVKHQRFTGRITAHRGTNGKLECLKEYCLEQDIGLERCVAVGDSESDIAIFKACGKSIAINCSDAMKGTASEYLITDDLLDVVAILETWLAE